MLISRDLAKRQLRLSLDSTDDNTLVDEAIADAQAWVENYTGQKLDGEEAVEVIDTLSASLRMWPIVSIETITYLDSAGDQQTLDSQSYRLLNATRPARLARVPGFTWPATYGEQSITVEMIAGYEDPAELPGGMRRALLLLITGYFENRDTGGLDDATELAAKRACGPASRAWRV